MAFTNRKGWVYCAHAYRSYALKCYCQHMTKHHLEGCVFLGRFDKWSYFIVNPGNRRILQMDCGANTIRAAMIACEKRAKYLRFCSGSWPVYETTETIAVFLARHGYRETDNIDLWTPQQLSFNLTKTGQSEEALSTMPSLL